MPRNVLLTHSHICSHRDLLYNSGHPHVGIGQANNFYRTQIVYLCFYAFQDVSRHCLRYASLYSKMITMSTSQLWDSKSTSCQAKCIRYNAEHIRLLSRRFFSPFLFCFHAFSALMLLVGGRKGIRPVKKSGGVLSWLSVWARCRFAYGPADTTATHYLLLQICSTRMILPFWCQLASLPRLS